MTQGPVVEFDAVCVERGGSRVLDDITFAVTSGSFVGVVGPNGAGKTTLLKTILGLVRPTTGRTRVFGRGPGARDAGIGYVPQRQSIEERFPATALDVVALGRLNARGLAARLGKDDRLAAARALDRVGVAALADRPVGALSGGEQRRVMLAQALCAEAQLLVLDEPTIGLDLPAEQAFYALLAELQRDLGLTVIAVSHDLVALASACDELICINKTMHVHGHPEDVIHSHAIEEAYSCEFDFLAGEIEHHERRAPRS
jgi:zinc transport system ATP-binding protein